VSLRWGSVGAAVRPYTHLANDRQMVPPLLLWRRGLGSGGPPWFSILRFGAAFHWVATRVDLAGGLRAAASSPWPSPPKEERETAWRPSSIEMRARCRSLLPLSDGHWAGDSAKQAGRTPNASRSSVAGPLGCVRAYWLDGAATRSSDRNGHPIREHNNPISFDVPADHCARQTRAVKGSVPEP